jgi:hypothetical protein
MDIRLIPLLFGLLFANARAAVSYPPVHHNWTRSEVMDTNGLYTLEWHVHNKEIIFKATVNTRGFIAIGFQYQNMKFIGYDLAVAWVDDRSAKTNILVSTIHHALRFPSSSFFASLKQLPKGNNMFFGPKHTFHS